MPLTRGPWKKVAEAAIARSGLLALLEELDRLPAEPVLRVLLFHRVDDEDAGADGPEPSLIGARPDVFAREMEYLADRFHPIGGVELLAALDGAPLPPRAVLVTFDDGYRDFRTNAWPALRRLGIPTMLFVPTGYVEHRSRGFWWDYLHRILSATDRHRVTLPGCGQLDLSTAAARRTSTYRARMYLSTVAGRAAEETVARLGAELGVGPASDNSILTWDELADLVREGVTVGPHGRWHRRLDHLSPAELEAEVAGSRDDLRAKLGDCPPFFSYPHGGVNAAAVAAVRRAGFRAAFSSRNGLARLDESERLVLRRIKIYDSTVPRFRLDLTRGFALYRQVRTDIAAKTAAQARPRFRSRQQAV